MLDIQSWWEVPSIAHFCSLFREAFNLLDFDIEDLEEALLTDGTEESSWLQELIVRLLSGCLQNNEISTFNYQMFLRRLFRQKCQEYDLFNPFNTDIDFQLLALRTKVDILSALCDFRLDAEDVLDALQNLEAASLRVEPLGFDGNESSYWYFYGTRLYREDFKNKNGKKGKAVWQVICFTEDDWCQLAKKFRKSHSKVEKQLYNTLTENFLPELPRLFREKESQARKRLLDSLPRRTSSRIRKQDVTTPSEKEDPKDPKDLIEEKLQKEKLLEEKRKKVLAERRKEAYERRARLKEQGEETTQSDYSEDRDEMAGAKAKIKKGKGRPRRQSESSASSRDQSSVFSSTSNRSSNRTSSRTEGSKPVSSVGRQTNNSLACATGQIVIQPVSNPHRKKLKTSQVFRQSDEDLQIGMHKILDFVKNDDDAWPFVDPVEEEYAPNYYSVIRKPMDLQKMEERLDGGQYKTFAKFKDDFQLIVDNCHLYNGADNEYTEMVDNLQKVFERATQRYLDELTSDEEIAVEYPDKNKDTGNNKRKKSISEKPSSLLKRKPTLSVPTSSRKRKRSDTEESSDEPEEAQEPEKKKDKITKKNEYKKEVLGDNNKKQSKVKGKSMEKPDKHTEKQHKLFVKEESEKTLKQPEKQTKHTKQTEKSAKLSSKAPKESEKQSKQSEKHDKHSVKSQKQKSEKVHIKDKHAEKLIKEKPKVKQFEKQVKENKEKTVKDKELEKQIKYKQSEKKQKHLAKKEKESERIVKHEGSKKRKDPKVKPKRITKKLDTPSPDRSKKRSFSPSPSRCSSSPPPSWPPSSPDDRFDFSPKRNTKKLSDHFSDGENSNKLKSKHDKWKEVYKEDSPASFKSKERSLSPPKHKDKHNKLRETIEKLKAKSELASKIKEKDKKEKESDKHKDIRDSSPEKSDNKSIQSKSSDKKQKPAIKANKKELNADDGESTADSTQSGKNSGAKSPVNNANMKNMEALTLATEQTLKDINKWLDDTPKFSEFSSASNSPSHFTSLEDFDMKLEQDSKKKQDKMFLKKEAPKDIKKKPFRDPTKLFRRREVQRTIDRLQPGKSKGNLISNIQNSNKPDELFALGPLSKTLKDTKNALIVKTDDSAPKLSLGSVLDSFGKHKFVDDPKKEDDVKDEKEKETTSVFDVIASTETTVTKVDKEPPVTTETKPEKDVKVGNSPGKATPNLSAWFKAFGAPKVQPPQKKSDKPEGKDADKTDDTKENKKEEIKKVPLGDPSPAPDSPIMPYGQPTPRQRRISTGSSMSERSSFSQDMDSPRVGIDERLAYPAPYPSPLHKSPSGASPILASPQHDASPKAYPAFNGQIRVGFYQDTVSTKSSPDKSCSPRDNPQSPYTQYSEHVYAPHTQAPTYSYSTPSYYSQTPSYSTSNPTPPHNIEQSNLSYFDTSKPLTDQYQSKVLPNYANSPLNSPIMQQNSPIIQQNSPIMQQNSPVMQQNSAIMQQNSPIMQQNSPIMPQHSPLMQQNSPAQITPHISPNPDKMHQEQSRLSEKQQSSTVFPVKKRAYNEMENMNRFEMQSTQRNAEMNLLLGRQEINNSMNPVINSEPTKQYVHQNIPEPRLSQNENLQQSLEIAESNSQDSNIQYSAPPANYNYNTEMNYPLNIPSTRSLEPERTMDMSKYSNMGYSGTDIGFQRTAAFNRQDLNYQRPTPSTVSVTQTQSTGPNQSLPMRYNDPNLIGYKSVQMTNASNIQPSQLQNMNRTNMLQTVRSTSESVSRLSQPIDVASGFKATEMSIPRPNYKASPLDIDQSLSLRNLGNLSQIVDRYSSDERMLGLQSTAQSFYGDKNLPGSHLLTKPIATSSSGLPMFSQSNIAIPYSHSMQGTNPMYNRQMSELPSGNLMNQEKTVAPQPQEKKAKKRKSAKTATPPTGMVDTTSSSVSGTQNQGFQSYAGLKNSSTLEPSAISLKTASVVPGSAFNFGPAPTGLGLGSGLYGDKDAYPNFLDDFRAAPNYYMAHAAAAHHRSTPDTAEKPVRTTHQSTPTQPPSYPFIGAPQPRPPSYPLGGAFMAPHQASLMDTSSPLYQQYLQAGMLHLGAPGAYPAGYHPTLSIRQPYDVNRPSWL